MLPCSMTVRALSSTLAGRPSSRSAAIDRPATAASPRPTPTQARAAMRRRMRTGRLGRRRGGRSAAVVRARSSVVSATVCSSWLLRLGPGGDGSPPPVTTLTRGGPTTRVDTASPGVTRHVVGELARWGRGGHRSALRRGRRSAIGPGSPCPSTTIAGPEATTAIAVALSRQTGLGIEFVAARRPDGAQQARARGRARGGGAPPPSAAGAARVASRVVAGGARRSPPT